MVGNYCSSCSNFTYSHQAHCVGLMQHVAELQPNVIGMQAGICYSSFSELIGDHAR